MASALAQIILRKLFTALDLRRHLERSDRLRSSPYAQQINPQQEIRKIILRRHLVCLLKHRNRFRETSLLVQVISPMQQAVKAFLAVPRRQCAYRA